MKLEDNVLQNQNDMCLHFIYHIDVSKVDSNVKYFIAIEKSRSSSEICMHDKQRTRDKKENKYCSSLPFTQKKNHKFTAKKKRRKNLFHRINYI